MAFNSVTGGSQKSASYQNAFVIQTRKKKNPLAVATLEFDWLVQIRHPSNKPAWKGVEIVIVWTPVQGEKEEPDNADATACALAVAPWKIQKTRMRFHRITAHNHNIEVTSWYSRDRSALDDVEGQSVNCDCLDFLFLPSHHPSHDGTADSNCQRVICSSKQDIVSVIWHARNKVIALYVGGGSKW